MSVISQDIDLKTFTSNVAVGSTSGGCKYGLVGNKEVVIQELVWYLTDNGIGRVMVKKHDKTCLTVGGMRPSETKPLVRWTFQPEEKFETIQLFSQNNRLAGVRMCTDKQKLQIGYVESNPIEISAGTGRCVGMFGNSGMCVDNLGFAMRRN